MADAVKSWTMVLPMDPVPQGRPRFAATPAGPRAYTPAKTRQAHATIRQLWGYLGRHTIPDGVPFDIEVVATFARPRSHRGKTGLTAAGRAQLVPRPDVDNLAKLVLDALQGHAFADDTYCRRLVVSKEWGTIGTVAVAASWE
jgi:Holliday junction resolvase RusA-like endonuclease